MSKKPVAEEPPKAAPTPVRDPVAEALAEQQHTLSDEALRRFSPYIFTFSTNTKENVELNVQYDALQRDPTIQPNFFSIERTETLNWFSMLSQEQATSLGSAAFPIAQLLQASQEVKTHLALLTDLAIGTDLTFTQTALVAVAIRTRVLYFALVREKARLAELEAIRQAHVELVEKYVEDGLSAADAEKAALAEEEAIRVAEEAAAQSAAEDDEEAGGVQRTQAFVCLKGYPLTPLDVIALSKQGLQVNALFTLNSLAKFGIRKDDLEKAKAAAAAAAAAAANTKGGKPNAADAKKAEPKKAAAPGKKGEEVAAVAPPADPLAIALKKEIARILAVSPFEVEHTLQQVNIWEYEVPTRQSLSAPVAAATADGQPPAVAYDLMEPESATVLRICERVVLLEQRLFDYQQWMHGGHKSVPALSNAACGQEEAAAAAAAALKARQAEEAAKAAAAAAATAGKKPAGKAAAKGAEVAAPVAAAALETSTDTFLPHPRQVPATLPHSVSQLKANLALYQKRFPASAATATSDQFLDAFVQALCIASLDQPPVPQNHNNAQQSGSAHGSATGTPAETPVPVPQSIPSPLTTPRQRQRDETEAFVTEHRQEVGAFVDFLLEQLDGVKAPSTSRPPTASKAVVKAESKAIGSVLDSLSTVFQHSSRVQDLVEAPVHVGELEAASKHHNNHPLRPVPVAAPPLPANLVECIRLALIKTGHGDTAEATLQSRQLIELLDAQLLQARVLEAAKLGRSMGNATVAHNAADTGLDVTVVTVPSNTTTRHRSRASWASFHGSPSFPQFNQWIDFLDQETAFFYPPPRDEDEEDEPEVEAALEEEDEEDEEEEEYEDEDGVIQTRMKKKEKKIILYDPVYVNYAEQQLTALRRRRFLELLKRQVSLYQTGRQNLVAHNHGAHVLYEEQELLFPEDDSVIDCTVLNGNSRTTHCTVYTAQSLCSEEEASFGFRAGPPESVMRSGVRSVVNLRDARMTITRTLPPVVPVTQEVEEPVVTTPTPAAPAPSGKTPRPTGSASQASPVPPLDARGNTPRNENYSTVSASPSHQNAFAANHNNTEDVTPLSTVIQLNMGAAHENITAVLNEQGKTLQLIPSAPLSLTRQASNAHKEHPIVLCYNAVSQTVQRRTVQNELHRQILRSGVVKVTLETTPLFKEDNGEVVAPAAATAAPIVTPSGAPPSGKREAPTKQSSTPVGGAPTSPHLVAPPPSTPSPTSVLPKAQPEEVELMLFPDGTMTSVWRGALLLTCINGTRTVRPAANGTPHTLSTLEVVQTYDASLLCTVLQRREDSFVSKYLFDDGREVVRFQDGTVFEREAVSAHTRLVLPSPYPSFDLVWDSPDHLGDGREGRCCQQVVAYLQHTKGFTHAQFVWEVPQESVRFESMIHPLRAYAGLSYANTMLHVLTTADAKEVRYVIDTLYGGMRVEGRTWCFHVTPFGRCRARTTEQEYAPLPTDFTIRHTLEKFFGEPEVLDKNIVARVKRAQEEAPSMNSILMLHTSEVVPPAPLKWAESEWTHGTVTVNPYSNTAMDHQHRRDVEQRVLALAKPLPGATTKQKASQDAVRIFVRLPDGRGLELMDPKSQTTSLTALLRAADIAATDVVQRPADDTAAQVVSVVASSKLQQGSEAFPSPSFLSNDVLSRPFLNEQLSLESFKMQSKLPLSVAKDSVTANAVQWKARHFARVSDVVSVLENTAQLPQHLAKWFAAIADDTAAKKGVESNTTLLHQQQQAEQQREPSYKRHSSSSNGGHQLPEELRHNRAKIENALDELKKQRDGLRPATLNFWNHGASADAKRETEAGRLLFANNALRNGGQEAPHTAAGSSSARSAVSTSSAVAVKPPSPAAPVGALTTIPEKPTAAPSSPHRFFSSAVRHVNPGPGASSSGAVGQGMVYSFTRKLTQQRIVSTPIEVDFGTVMEGFRYSTTIQLTNVATQSSRYRVTIIRTSAPEQPQETVDDSTLSKTTTTGNNAVPWLSVSYAKLPIAAGMSVTIELEIDGTQPVGQDIEDVALHVAYENGGMILVPVRLHTRSASERPVSQQKSHIRMIGPSRMKYVPGSVVKSAAH